MWKHYYKILPKRIKPNWKGSDKILLSNAIFMMSVTSKSNQNLLEEEEMILEEVRCFPVMYDKWRNVIKKEISF